MRPPGTAETLERRRRRAIELFREGLQPVEIASRLGVDRRSVRRWRASFETRGQDGLAARPPSGRPPKLDERELARREAALLRGARAAGFSTDLWTCPRVADLIRRRFRVEYHVDHLGRLLRRLGWTPQRPERRAIERDEERIRGWVKHDWPRVKKTPRSTTPRSFSSTKADS